MALLDPEFEAALEAAAATAGAGGLAAIAAWSIPTQDSPLPCPPSLYTALAETHG